MIKCRAEGLYGRFVGAAVGCGRGRPGLVEQVGRELEADAPEDGLDLLASARLQEVLGVDAVLCVDGRREHGPDVAVVAVVRTVLDLLAVGRRDVAANGRNAVHSFNLIA